MDSISLRSHILVEQSGLARIPGSLESRDEPRASQSCRICLMGVEQEWIQMDCACKGELAIAHVDCAVRWFSIRGNSSCDVCGEAIGNLPALSPRKPCYQQQDQSYPVVLDQDDDDYYDPIDSSCSKIAVLVASSTIGFFRQKLRALAEFP